MAPNHKVKILYRIAEKANKNTNKNKPLWISNKQCLANIAKNKTKDATLLVFGDRLTAETSEFAKKIADKYLPTTAHGNAETFLEVFSFALSLAPDTIVYFSEDDYLHLPDFDKYIAEGLDRAKYVTLYDHPDKYNGAPVQLFYTKSCHWKVTESTTMTFAAKVSTLLQDQNIFTNLIKTGNPPDHYIFLELGKKGRTLISAVPGLATHGEQAWLAPTIDWQAR